jgi:hypothetical protein
MHAAEPAIDAVELTGIDFSGEDPLSCWREGEWLCREQRNARVDECLHVRFQHGVTEKRRGFLLLVRVENIRVRFATRRDRLKNLSVGSRQSVRRARELFQVTLQRGAKKGQGVQVCSYELLQSERVRRAKGFPGAGTECELGRRDAATLRPKRRELRCGQIAESAEPYDAGEGIDTDHVGRRFRLFGQRREDLDKLKLIVQVVFEPQDDIARGPQCGVTSAEIASDIREGARSPCSQKPRPHVAHRFERESGWRGTFVEDVTPCDYLSGHTGFAQENDRGIAIGNVQHGREQRDRFRRGGERESRPRVGHDGTFPIG